MGMFKYSRRKEGRDVACTVGLFGNPPPTLSCPHRQHSTAAQVALKSLEVQGMATQYPFLIWSVLCSTRLFFYGSHPNPEVPSLWLASKKDGFQDILITEDLMPSEFAICLTATHEPAWRESFSERLCSLSLAVAFSKHLGEKRLTFWCQNTHGRKEGTLEYLRTLFRASSL